MHLSRGAWLRGHISVFAFGIVVLLSANLLRGSGGIWADTAISAWAVLVLAHGILMIIARLLQELLADEEDSDIRPASEMHWNVPSTWTLPPRTRDRRPAGPPPAQPTLDPEASAAAAAARDRKVKPAAPQEPKVPLVTAEAPKEPPATAAEPAESDRVSWKAATDAAWLAPRETTPKPEPAKETPPDDEDDFTPLKFT